MGAKHPTRFGPLRLRKGVCIAFLGLDGAGKSTLLMQLIEALEEAGVETRSRHMHPGLLPPLARLAFQPVDNGPVTDPHGKRPSGLLVSFLRLTYYWVDYVSGYAFLVFPYLAFPGASRQGRAFIFDRYSYDYLVDPLRCRVRLPAWLVRLFCWATPSPDLSIVLVAAPEVLRARKPELPLDELRSQAARLTALAEGLPQATCIDTSAPVEECHQQVLDAVRRFFPTQLRARGAKVE
jgi:thymidylate kinase